MYAFENQPTYFDGAPLHFDNLVKKVPIYLLAPFFANSLHKYIGTFL